MRTDTGHTVRLADYAPTPYAAPSCSLMVALDPKVTIVRNSTDYEPRGDNAGPLVLAGDELNLLSAHLDSVQLDESAYTATADQFILHEPPQRRFELTLTTAVNPDENTKLMGLYRSQGVYCTQCEAEGFRRITYAYDRPDVLSIYDVWLVADSADVPVLLSNGNLVDSGIMNGKPYARWIDPFPKPTYLFALVAGALGVTKDTFRTMSGRDVALAIYVEPGKEERALYAMDALKRSMRWDEERFGREYDLDVFNIVAVSDFNMGAMENKGLNVFNDRYILADPLVATDADYAGIETVVAHEYFHNWTGNRITCRDWFQLCLKEGLTVFRDQEFTSDVRSRGVKRVADVKRLRQAQFREDASPLRHCVRPKEYDEISNLYTATVYDKGAELIRMIHTLVGDAGFRAGMDLYFERYDGTAAVMEDFLSCFPLPDQNAFLRWYQEPGTPVVRAELTHDAGVATLTLEQQPAEGASAKPIPVRFALFDEQGADVTDAARVGDSGVTDEMVVLGADPIAITLACESAPIASVMRGFSAPVIVDQPLDEARDCRLLAVESDPFAAWDAAQRLLIGALKRSYFGEPEGIDAIASALDAVISDDAKEPAFRGLLLSLPTHSALVEAVGQHIDADKIESAGKAVRVALAQAIAPTLERLVHAAGPADMDVSPEAAGARALRNAALLLSACAGNTAMASAQAREAKNMTDQLAALSALSAAEASDVEGALVRFFETYRDEALVLDKYFSLQVMRTDGDPLTRAHTMTTHSAFSLRNPNRVRSVIGAFGQNIAAFHRADGKGYRFVADTVLELDEPNPQLAARLLTLFSEYRRFDLPRQTAAREVLGTVASAAKSSDVSDIVRRLLG